MSEIGYPRSASEVLSEPLQSRRPSRLTLPYGRGLNLVLSVLQSVFYGF